MVACSWSRLRGFLLGRWGRLRCLASVEIERWWTRQKESRCRWDMGEGGICKRLVECLFFVFIESIRLQLFYISGCHWRLATSNLPARLFFSDASSHLYKRICRRYVNVSVCQYVRLSALRQNFQKPPKLTKTTSQLYADPLWTHLFAQFSLLFFHSIFAVPSCVSTIAFHFTVC